MLHNTFLGALSIKSDSIPIPHQNLNTPILLTWWTSIPIPIPIPPKMQTSIPIPILVKTSIPQYQYQVLSVSAVNVTGETWVSPVSVGQVREPPTRFFHTQNLGSVGQYTRVDCMPWIDPMVIDYVSKVIRIDTSRPRRVVCATSKQKDSLNGFASIHRAHQKLFIIFPWSQILNVKKSSHLFSHNFQGYKSPNDKGFFQAPFNILLNRLQIITWLCKSFPTSISKTRTG